MLVVGPARRTPIPPRFAYPWLLRVQMISADSRPTKASRITSKRIISRSSFLLLAKARAVPGLSRLKLKCFAQEPAHSPSAERFIDYGTLLYL